MKNDRQTYKTQYSPSYRLPMICCDIGNESIAQTICHCEPEDLSAVCLAEVGESNLKYFKKDCFDKMMARFPLKTSGNDHYSFCHSRPDCHRQSGLSGILERSKIKIPTHAGMTNKRGSSPPIGKPPTGFSESDVGRPSDLEYDVSNSIHKAMFFDIETTYIIEGEKPHSCELTMEEVLSRWKIPPDRDIGKYSQKVGIWYQKECQSIQSPQERDVSISWMKEQIHNTSEKVFGRSKMKQKKLNKLQLEADELYSSRLFSPGSLTDSRWQYIMECDFSAVDDFTGPPLGWRNKNWYHECGWQNYALPMPLSASITADLSASRLAEWNSIVVESVRLILQRWSRVYSFSSTICCTWEKSGCKTHIAFTQEKISQPKRMIMLRTST